MRAEFLCSERLDGHLRQAGELARWLGDRKWPVTPARAEQVHGAKVVVVPALHRERSFPAADGLLTDAHEQPLAIFTADCVPLFLAAPKAGVVGLLHAGWRGVRDRILGEALREMRRRWAISPRDVEAWTGPSIGPCCFEVRWDVARYFPSSRRRKGTGWRVDLAGELARQARRQGVRWRPTRDRRECTAHQQRYFSYRRDATPERQVSVIRIPS